MVLSGALSYSLFSLRKRRRVSQWKTEVAHDVKNDYVTAPTHEKSPLREMDDSAQRAFELDEIPLYEAASAPISELESREIRHS